jgi:hypothetical protein
MDNEYSCLIHYASPYYDPVKAHEYYEQHKKLKGRRSTAGLNEKGREAARYIKEQINAEKKARIKVAKDTKDSNIQSRREAKKSQVEQHKSEMNSRISSLRDRLKSMSKEDKAAHRTEIQNEINSLREENRQIRESLNAQFNREKEGFTSKYKSDVESYRKDADTKYERELERLKASGEFKQVKKGRKGSGKKKSSADNQQVRLEWDAKNKRYK